MIVLWILANTCDEFQIVVALADVQGTSLVYN